MRGSVFLPPLQWMLPPPIPKPPNSHSLAERPSHWPKLARFRRGQVRRSSRQVQSGAGSQTSGHRKITGCEVGFGDISRWARQGPGWSRC